MSADRERLINALRDRYEIERELGAGGMAERPAGWTDGLTDVRI